MERDLDFNINSRKFNSQNIQYLFVQYKDPHREVEIDKI